MEKRFEMSFNQTMHKISVYSHNRKKEFKELWTRMVDNHFRKDIRRNRAHRKWKNNGSAKPYIEKHERSG